MQSNKYKPPTLTFGRIDEGNKDDKEGNKDDKEGNKYDKEGNKDVKEEKKEGYATTYSHTTSLAQCKQAILRLLIASHGGGFRWSQPTVPVVEPEPIKEPVSQLLQDGITENK